MPTSKSLLLLPALALCLFLICFQSPIPSPQSLYALDLSGPNFRDPRNQVSSFAGRTSSSSFRLDLSQASIAITTQTSPSFLSRSGLIPIYYYPSTVTNLSALTGFGPGQISLSWSAPGGSGSESIASRYVLKYALAPIGSRAGFDSAAAADQALSPLSFGQSESTTTSGLDQNVFYYFRLEPLDADNNPSLALSNEASATSQITITGLTLTTTFYSFGTLGLGQSSVTASAFILTNSGNISQSYVFSSTISAPSISPWVIGASSTLAPGEDLLVMEAAFHGARPLSPDFGGFENAVSTAPVTASASRLTIDQSELGAGVPPGEVRNLWMKLTLPLTSSTSAQHKLGLNVSVTSP